MDVFDAAAAAPVHATRFLPAHPSEPARPGAVHLVGAGPGDPGLLTVRAATLLRTCDVVFHDHLASPDVLATAAARASRIDVGKIGHGTATSQAAITDGLIDMARAGRRVVRLKGGDPFVFGRGGEEALALAAAGVPFEVVPGVSALAAVPASAGIPLTHRGYATSVGVVTGSCAGDGHLADALGGAALADTLVAFMALANLEGLATAVQAAGRPASTPAAAIESGTTSGQRSVVSTIGELADDVGVAGLRAPVLVVVGEVVRLHAALAPRDGWQRDTAPAPEPLAARSVDRTGVVSVAS
ncbi:MAG TPA: uroporphyrinogen-III C-methyltransferase [Luteitalea sp.]|nr:uroporphyrinogen-III C-methyltransferase [Luteitalea sp.]